MNSLDSMEGMEAEEEPPVLRHPDGSLWQFMPKVDGKCFCCNCGCNVFHKFVGMPNLFICNSCDEHYISS